MNHQDIARLHQWYLAHQRPLPWRENRDPYRVWVSEVMLQQTTVVVVTAYFERFMRRFPTLASLAAAELGDVCEVWAGLGYYSRARNLHRAAREIAALGNFPTQFEELIKLPGFGPYTARAVASICFDQRVGVLDGNVIRVLSRWLNWEGDWWRPRQRAVLQETIDGWMKHGPEAGILNQAFMELGATICTPTSPTCLLCPVQTSCSGRKAQKHLQLPKQKPKRAREIWLWRPVISSRRGKLAFIKNEYAPFLKGQLIYPGEAIRMKKRPKQFDFRHSVTHHDIYVQIEKAALAKLPKAKWISLKELSQHVPLSLIRKALDHVQKN